MEWKSLAEKWVDRAYVLILAGLSMYFTISHNAHLRIDELTAKFNQTMTNVDGFAKDAQARLQALEQKVVPTQPGGVQPHK